MHRTLLIYLSVGLFLLLGILLIEWARPKESDWRLSFSRDHDRPFGASLLYEQSEEIFPDGEVRSSRKTLYRSRELWEPGEGSMFFLTEHFEANDRDLDLLFDHVESGGKLFVSARRIDRGILDSLDVQMSSSFIFDPSVFDDDEESDTVRLGLKRPKDVPSGGYPFKDGLGESYFSSINPINAEVLGRDGEDRIVFTKVDWRGGTFYLHSKPLAFTNYYTSQEESYRYAFQALSHLPPEDLYWDEYYKPFSRRSKAQSPLRFLLQHPSLRVALYLTLIGLLLLISFGAKRVQRPMPMHHPPRNATLSYARTLARLYFEDGGHQRIARMKAEHFLVKLQKRTGMQKERIRSQDAWEYVATRCALPLEAFKEAMREVEEALNGNGPRTEEELMAFERKLREIGTQTQTATPTQRG